MSYLKRCQTARALYRALTIWTLHRLDRCLFRPGGTRPGGRSSASPGLVPGAGLANPSAGFRALLLPALPRAPASPRTGTPPGPAVAPPGGSPAAAPELSWAPGAAPPSCAVLGSSFGSGCGTAAPSPAAAAPPVTASLMLARNGSAASDAGAAAAAAGALAAASWIGSGYCDPIHVLCDHQLVWGTLVE